MREYDYKARYVELLTPDIVGLLSAIHELKGAQSLLTADRDDTFLPMVEQAKLQSTDASNKIEGIFTSDDRLKSLVEERTMPRSRNEQEIAGLRDALSIIHTSYLYIPPRPSVILQLHRDLYKYTGAAVGGSYKTADNAIKETRADGTEVIRFRPSPAWETPEAMDRACAAYEDALRSGECDPLLLIPMFVLDFLCIHPFTDGTGRMSRLLTLLLLYRAGYPIGKYVSLDKRISETKDAYYEALAACNAGWHEGKNDYAPFVRYLLGVIAACYQDFDQRARALVTPKPTWAEAEQEAEAAE